MYNPMSLLNKRIFITGAASGIGKKTAEVVCKLGGHVFLLDVNKVGIEDTLKSCSAESGGAVVDICDEAAVKEVVMGACSRLGKFDGLVHCAGLSSIEPLRSLKMGRYEEVMRVNTTAAIALAQLFSGKRVNTGAGSSIVLISSVYGLVGSACNVAYAASKAAITGITKSLAIELAAKGIRVNCIAPGFIKTNMAEQVECKFDQNYSALIEKMHPLGWGETIDIAHGIAYLLSEAAKWVTGSVMSIDGGFTAQ